MGKKVKILLAEDDINLGSLLTQYLNAKNFETDLFGDGEKAWEGFNTQQYDICILDVMMPKKDGFTLAKEIRELNQKTPIIFLTAKTLKDDVLEGFKIGADDYITKPFVMDELLFRIEAILRRINQSGDGMTNQETYKIGKYTFDVQKQLLNFEDETIKLTTKEAELFELLCANKNAMLERNYALKLIWKDDNYFNARSMDVYITKLRKHLKKDENIEIINVHGKGYKLIVSV
ncbi:MAG: DNA-binding response regulator [Bacteroidetes bacterium]|nr:MAG: DNA-binding response regulator [Bacteroidota bacterium]